jgi:hypothetical protein
MKDSPMAEDELREKLAAIEHERWSDWQTWCHKVIRSTQLKGGATLEEVLARWDKQIITPYSALSDTEKASDMKQVDRYWGLIQSYIDTKIIEARKTEIEFLYDIADDELKAKLREAYKYRGVNFGLSFTPAPENDTGRKALNHRKDD